jgi:hypothetical protein
MEPEGTETHLFFEHSGFNLNDPLQKFSYGAMGKGWAELGANLGRVIEALQWHQEVDSSRLARHVR